MTRRQHFLIFGIAVGTALAILLTLIMDRVDLSGEHTKRDRCEEMGGVWVHDVDNNVCIDAPTIEVNDG